MKVTFYYREYRKGNFSIEMLFKTILSSFGARVQASNFYVQSKINMLSIVKAFFSQGEVNHITGDVNYLALVLKGSKTVLTIHDIGHYEHTLTGWKKYMYKKIWFEFPLSKVAIITTVSEFTKQKLIDTFKIRPDKIIVIYNPVPPAFVFTSLPVKTSSTRILQIGSGENKNIEKLIEAIQGLSCELILVRKYSDQLDFKIKQAGIKCTWHYNVSETDIVNMYKASDIVYFASTYEGFGMPIIEAQAIGRPVITSSIASMPEIAGEGACLVNPYNDIEIRNTILKIVNDTTYRDHLISNGLENCKRFQVNKIAEEYIQLYKRIVKS